jgi:hypothetical protein
MTNDNFLIQGRLQDGSARMVRFDTMDGARGVEIQVADALAIGARDAHTRNQPRNIHAVEPTAALHGDTHR